jgi:hypothetical protein
VEPGYYPGSGGGGAGSAGIDAPNASYFQSGSGGAGIVSTITGAQQIYANGGSASGATYFQTYPGNSSSGNAGTPYQGPAQGPSGNTGSGGNGGQGTGANGASGIVAIRYPSFYAPANSTTGNPVTYIAGPYRVYVFNASGTITF